MSQKSKLDQTFEELIKVYKEYHTSGVNNSDWFLVRDLEKVIKITKLSIAAKTNDIISFKKYYKREYLKFQVLEDIAIYGRLEILKYLHEEKDVEIEIFTDEYVMIAIIHKEFDILKYLVSKGAVFDIEELLNHIINTQNIDILEYLYLTGYRWTQKIVDNVINDYQENRNDSSYEEDDEGIENEFSAYLNKYAVLE